MYTRTTHQANPVSQQYDSLANAYFDTFWRAMLCPSPITITDETGRIIYATMPPFVATPTAAEMAIASRCLGADRPPLYYATPVTREDAA